MPVTVPDAPDWTAAAQLFYPPLMGDSPDWIRAFVEVAASSATGDYPDWTEVVIIEDAKLPVTSPPGGPTFWYDAQQINGLGNNSGVVTWLDSSGNGHTLTVPSGATPPIYVNTGVNTINGHPSLFFAGVSTNHSPTLQSASLTIAAPYSLCAVISLPSTEIWNQAFWDDAVNEVPTFLFNSTEQIAFSDGVHFANFGSALSLGNPGHSFCLSYNAGSTFMNLDGTDFNPSSGTYGSVNITTGFLLGSISNQWGDGYNGSLGELLIYPFALTVAQAAAVHAYFANKWGVP